MRALKVLIENWYIVTALCACTAVAAIAVYNYFGLPSGEQRRKIKEWLVYACMEAERELGTGTGQLKLRKVYDAFLTKFGWLAKFVSFEVFSKLVDEALEDVKEMLATNNAVRGIVVKEEGSVEA